jgi:transcriptional regulator with XRE-family HTH domain
LGKRTRHSIGTIEFDLLQTALREARERAGLSQREMARRLGFHESVYGKIERGDRVLDVIEFVAFADAADQDAIELFGNYLERIRRLPKRRD